MNRRQHKRRIYKRMGYQIEMRPFTNFSNAFTNYFHHLHESLKGAVEQWRLIGEALRSQGERHGPKDTQAQTADSHQ